MLNSTVTISGEPKKPEYPCLMRSERGNVILFRKHGSGTIMESISKFYRVGHYSDSWVMGDFFPLPTDSTVTLTQE